MLLSLSMPSRQNMAYELRILPSAEAEVESIVNYLAGLGAQAARRFVDAYRNQLNLIANGIVEYGLSRMPELAELGYHACFVNSYVMLFYYDDKKTLLDGENEREAENQIIVVAHVFHQSQDYARLVVSKDQGSSQN